MRAAVLVALGACSSSPGASATRAEPAGSNAGTQPPRADGDRDDGATWVSRTLEIIPAGIAKDYPGGDVPPADGEHTGMLESTAMGQSKAAAP